MLLRDSELDEAHRGNEENEDDERAQQECLRNSESSTVMPGPKAASSP